ncbi:MAG: glycosyltransferase [Candidatus Yanofskybacteria bacterium]|nr:glycosyltransferase [Candidatus Yanofskybacteria bacterium]
MKILLVAPPAGFWDQVQTALNGVATVGRFDTRRFMLAGGVGSHARSLWRGIRSVPPLKRLNSWCIGRELIRVSAGYDAVLLYKFGDVPSAAIAHLRRNGTRVAAWQIDPPNAPDIERAWRTYAPHADVVFHFDGALAASRQPCRMMHLPLAVDVERFAPMRAVAERHAYDANISFIGAPYPERVRLLERVAHRGLALYGWSGWRATSLASLYRGPVTVDEAAHIYARSKIAVNSNWTPPIAGVNLKTFEIPAAGGMQLTDLRADLPGLFVPEEEIAVFRNDDEFEQQVERLLTDDAARERIRGAGVARVIRDHTLRARVAKIVEVLETLR